MEVNGLLNNAAGDNRRRHTGPTNTCAVLLSLIATACAKPLIEQPIHHPIVEVSGVVPGASYSLHEVNDELHVLLTDQQTSSLYLYVHPAERLTFIDRTEISAHAPQSHLYLTLDDAQHVFYVDREETDVILKWISREVEDPAWTVQTISPPGNLLGAAIDQTEIIVLWSDQDRLLARRFPSMTNTAVVPSRPFHSVTGDTTPLSAGDRIEFVVHDPEFDTLLLFRFERGQLSERELLKGGETHFAVIGDDGVLRVLAYLEEFSRIDLYEDTGVEQLDRIPVTIANGTTSLFFAGHHERLYVLYDEIITGKTGRVFQLSLLHPSPLGGHSGFEKAILLESTDPFLKVRALLHEGTLWIAYLQSAGLRIMTVDLTLLR